MKAWRDWQARRARRRLYSLLAQAEIKGIDSLSTHDRHFLNVELIYNRTKGLENKNRTET